MMRHITAAGLLLAATASQAITIDLPGYDFAATASGLSTTDTFVITSTTLPTSVTSTEEAITDLFVTTYAFSTGTGVMDITFGDGVNNNLAIGNEDGVDLSIFFISAPPHSVSLSLFNDNTSVGNLSSSSITYTGNCVDKSSPLNGSCSDVEDIPIYVMDLDFSSFGISASAIDLISMDVSNASAVPSLLGAYSLEATTPVPVPASLWLMASGLGVLGLRLRKKQH